MPSVPATAFREALARFASGVAIITCHTPAGPAGFTVSSFSSVSLDPPLVLFCVAKTASAYDAIVAASSFGISILEARQASIALQFAKQGIDRFDGVALRAGAAVPLIDGALAQLECSTHTLHDAGDHTIVVGHVAGAHHHAGQPLLHFGRSFGGFTPA